MSNEILLSTLPAGHHIAENNNGKLSYNFFELLWFCISYKYGKWFAPIEILEVKKQLTEKQVTEFILEAAKHGFFETFCNGVTYEFRTAVIWENCNVQKT